MKKNSIFFGIFLTSMYRSSVLACSKHSFFQYQHPTNANAEPTANTKATKKAEITGKRKRQFKLFLSQVVKVVSDHHYNTVMRQATSLQWVCEEIEKNYDIQQKGVHFFNILDLTVVKPESSLCGLAPKVF